MNKNIIYKIIYKYKNINRNTQYDIFIFLGNTDSSIINILNIINNYSFFDVLTKLNSNEHTILIEYYGINWYYNFFNYHHIKYTFDDIIKNNMKSFILKNLDINIYNNYFSNFNDKKNIDVGYNKIIDNNLYLNYIKNKNINNTEFFNKILLGGNKNDNDNNNDNDNEIINISDIIDININEEIELIDDKNLINEINNIKKKNKINNNYYLLNNKKFNNHNDEKLINVYNKTYIYDFLIYNDDNIKNIKRKITSVIKINENINLLPQYIYLWSNYIDIDYNINNIRLGYELLLDNKLINEIIEPLDINYYLNENIKNEDIYNIINKINKIKYENNENFILNEYGNYINNNEIYMIDIINELGYKNNYSNTNIKKNILDIYCKLYFNQINNVSLDAILNFLNNNNNDIITNNNNIYNTIQNDVFLENEIIKNTDNYNNLISKTKEF